MEVSVTIRAISERQKEFRRKRGLLRAFVTFHALESGVFSLQCILRPRMIKPSCGDDVPRHGGVTRPAIVLHERRAVGACVTRGAVFELLRCKGDCAPRFRVHLCVALLARDLRVAANERKPGGRMIERRDDLPAFRSVTGSARLVGEFPSVRRRVTGCTIVVWLGVEQHRRRTRFRREDCVTL